MYSYIDSRGRESWTSPEYAKADAQVRSTAMQQPALFAKNFADNFAAYQSGLSNNTTNQANFYGSLASQAALAQAANSAMIGSLGTAALTGFGQAAQGAFDAWKGNQQSYNSALASMHDANQRGVTGAGALGALSQFSGNFGGGDGGGRVFRHWPQRPNFQRKFRRQSAFRTGGCECFWQQLRRRKLAGHG